MGEFSTALVPVHTKTGIQSQVQTANTVKVSDRSTSCWRIRVVYGRVRSTAQTFTRQSPDRTLAPSYMPNRYDDRHAMPTVRNATKRCLGQHLAITITNACHINAEPRVSGSCDSLEVANDVGKQLVLVDMLGWTQIPSWAQRMTVMLHWPSEFRAAPTWPLSILTHWGLKKKWLNIFHTTFAIGLSLASIFNGLAEKVAITLTDDDTTPHWVNILRPRQTCRHFADDILKCIFLNENSRDFWTPKLQRCNQGVEVWEWISNFLTVITL